MLTREATHALANALNGEGVRFLLVGGIAVVAHGYARFTSDLDMVLDLAAENVRRALACFTALGYRPGLPVALEDFADARKRQERLTGKDMVVFPLWRDSAIGPAVVDLFIAEPFPFAAAWDDAVWQQHADGTRFPYVDLRRLIAMKRAAGRPRDLLDVDELERLHGRHA